MADRVGVLALVASVAAERGAGAADHPMAAGRVQGRATALGAVHAMRPEGDHAAAPELGRVRW
jgi:hypothetical protein